MASTAHDESYGNPRWRHRSRGPWSFWGCGGQQTNWRDRDGEGNWSAQSWGPAWGHHPYWGPHFIPKPLLIVATVLGFIWWWPIGLVLLAVTISHRRMCGYRRWASWHSAGPEPGAGWKNWFGGDRPPGGPAGGGPSSGNRAFDEYRAETLHRLEQEQKEFTEFLDRLRFAKDKAEFDQFVNERRNRPSGAPPESPAEPAR
jgi:Protein of unknown function (DUF2852)